MTAASLALYSKRSVFIVDDSADIRDFFGLLAELKGFSLDCASNGVDGLDKLARLEQDPAIILVDLNMPSMNGDEFVRKIHERGLAKSSRVVILSAAEQGLVERLDKSIEWLKKPFSITDVMRIINQARSH